MTGPEEEFADEFAVALLKHGVQRIYLQGRLESARSTHPFSSVDKEVQVFRNTHYLWHKEGQCAMLDFNSPNLSKSW